jgi:hypothetical protein
LALHAHRRRVDLVTKAMARLMAALAGSALVSFLSAGEALAVVQTVVTLRGDDITNTTVGGAGIPVSTHSDSGTTPRGHHSTISGGTVTADATQGQQEGSLFGGIEDFAAPSPRLSGFAGFTLDQTDGFTIGPCTGLPSGAPVKVRVQVRASGNVSLGGSPSGGSIVSLAVVGVPGIGGNWFSWNTGGLNPPQDLDIDEYWEVQADSTVDASFNLRALSIATLGSTAYEGNGTNTLDFAVIVRVSPGDGFEDCVITSEAGAPTTPLPPKVPALPPLALGLLAGAVAGLGVIGAIRSSRARGRRAA